MAENTFKSPGFFEQEIELTAEKQEPTGVPAGIIGAAQMGRFTKGASQTGAPVSPVDPVSWAAKVKPKGDCATAISAAACGSVNVARRMKNPAALPQAARLWRPRRKPRI